MFWPIIAQIASGILAGKNESAGNLAKFALGMAGNSAKSTQNNMPQPQTIGG